jgi:hypothetical protein
LSTGIKNILEELELRSIETLHNVDATNLMATKSLKKSFFDAIIWNFPCVR